MKKTLTTQKLICSVVMSAILSGCLPGSNIGGSSDVNNNVTPYSSPEHLIDKDPNKKLSKEELYKKVAKDYENRPAKVEQTKVIDNTLVKLPWQLLDKHDDTNSSIERVASDWEGTLTRHSIDPNQRTKDMNGKDVAAKDLPAHLYHDNGELKILVRADDGINYANNGENRKQLLYATIKAMLSGHEVDLDGNFIQALHVEKSNRYLEGNNVKQLLAISDLTPEIINGIEYREIAENALAYLLANYHEEPEGMIYFYPEMASYLDKFEAENLVDIDNLNERYFGSNIVGEKLSDKEKQTIQSVHRLIANNVYDSPTAMYENLIFRDKIDKKLIKDLDDAVFKLVNKKNNAATSTTSISLEISNEEIDSLMKSIFVEPSMLNDEQENNVLDFVRKNYKFNSILAKYYHIKMNSMVDNFGLQYASLLAANLAVCDNFAILNYFILKQNDEFKNDLMIPVQIGSGHTVLAVQHKVQIYIVDSWISFLHADEKIKPFFGELDSYLTYIDQNFAGEKKSTWHEYGRYNDLKNIITFNINQATSSDFFLASFGGKGVELENKQQVYIINEYITNLK